MLNTPSHSVGGVGVLIQAFGRQNISLCPSGRFFILHEADMKYFEQGVSKQFVIHRNRPNPIAMHVFLSAIHVPVTISDDFEQVCQSATKWTKVLLASRQPVRSLGPQVQPSRRHETP